MDDSEIIESHSGETKTTLTNFNEKKATCKMQKFLYFTYILLFTIALLIAVSIYCYVIKYWGKQKLLSIFHNKNNELREVLNW